MHLFWTFFFIFVTSVASRGLAQDSGFTPLSGLFSFNQGGPPGAPSPSSQTSGGAGFISVNQLSFTDQTCQEYIPIGFNAWTDVNLAATNAAAKIPLPVASLYDQNDAVSNYFKAAKQAGFNVVRIFGHGNSSTFTLQTGPGQYNETVFRGLDYIIAQAGVNKLKVVFVVINNWLDASVGGGKLKYCEWAKLSHEDEFWTDNGAMQLVKGHLAMLANRKNVFTGVPYNQDPNIFYWELFYEPRCPASQQGAGCPGSVTSWYDSMAQYMKTQDSNHLISTGEEGFFAINSTLVAANPWGIPSQSAGQGRMWSANLGQDFEEQHRRPSIGLATFQMWPDNYNTSDPNFASVWIGNHTIAARAIGKPLILDEFGKHSYQADESDRIALFRSVFEALARSLVSRDSFKGVLFWRWPIDNSSSDGTTVAPEQPTFKMLQQKISDLQAYTHNTMASCAGPVNVLAFAQQG